MPRGLFYFVQPHQVRRAYSFRRGSLDERAARERTKGSTFLERICKTSIPVQAQRRPCPPKRHVHRTWDRVQQAVPLHLKSGSGGAFAKRHFRPPMSPEYGVTYVSGRTGSRNVPRRVTADRERCCGPRRSPQDERVVDGRVLCHRRHGDHRRCPALPEQPAAVVPQVADQRAPIYPLTVNGSRMTAGRRAG